MSSHLAVVATILCSFCCLIASGTSEDDNEVVNASYFEAPAEPANRFTPEDLVGACYERDVWNVLFDEGAMRPEFFDLSSGFAGDMVQKLANYGIRMAIVISDTAAYSEAFHDFVRESNRSGRARFFQDRTDAISWLGGS